MKPRLFNRITQNDEHILRDIQDNVRSIVLNFRHHKDVGRNLSDEIMFYEPRLCASPSRATFDEETCKLLDSVYKEYLG